MKVFIGYSYRSKAYKCLNLSTNKIVESAHVRIDEFAKKIEEESKKELEDYRRFVYFESETFPSIFDNKETSTLEPTTITKLQEVQTES